MPVTRRVRSDPSWLGLGSASHLLGVSPATLRRWSDSGRIKVYTTPGGHRRFSRAALEGMLPADRVRRPTMERLGETADRVARLLGAGARRSPADARWLRSIDEDQRGAFRERGRALAGSLLTYLDASTTRERRDRLEACTAAAEDYGRIAASAGMSLADAVQGYLRFRGPFIAEMAALSRRKGLDTTEATELLQSAEEATDRLLVATMRGHERATSSIPQGMNRRPSDPSRRGFGIA